MYTLRKITPSYELNYYLGNDYRVVDMKNFEYSFKEEKEYYFSKLPENSMDNNEDVNDKIYAFVFTDKGQTIPLYMSDLNFIMTESGKTFSNLTFK